MRTYFTALRQRPFIVWMDGLVLLLILQPDREALYQLNAACASQAGLTHGFFIFGDSQRQHDNIEFIPEVMEAPFY